ncbi:hypothetical protein AGRA3207_002575 [Actinomadura graeca]|uniref:Uncharacterized protein n=1 Tax=Actinomadura graeca TaxID=2750812 RepID=A0ABX8QS96_9ACTN|nr:hypothetical protein [Actinomadura graeca]QXJ21696.1 hypothetical protein AGRA3207_002575 [Actinomadura graeca]
MNDKADRETERVRAEAVEPEGENRSEARTRKRPGDDKRKLSDAARKMRAMFEK